MTTKKATLEKIQAAEKLVTNKTALSDLATARKMVGELREPAPVEPTPPVTPPVEPPVVEKPPWTADSLSDFYLQGTKVVEDVAPDGSLDKVLRFDCNGTDGTNITENPRAQAKLEGLTLPKEFWWSGAFWLPTTFPTNVPGWWNLLEGPYAPPYNGSPPVSIQLSGNRLQWISNEWHTGKDQIMWSLPYAPLIGKKTSYKIIVEQSAKKEANGLVEMWINGAQMCSAAWPTLDGSNYQGPQNLWLQSYRKLGMFSQTISLYHWFPKIGATRASVGG